MTRPKTHEQLQGTTIIQRYFPGKDNAGLRQAIRKAIAYPMCARWTVVAVERVGRYIALSPQGAGKLKACAAALASKQPSTHRRCVCDACYAANSQLIGANG